MHARSGPCIEADTASAPGIDCETFDPGCGRPGSDRGALPAPGLVTHPHAVRDEATNGMLRTGSPLRFSHYAR